METGASKTKPKFEIAVERDDLPFDAKLTFSKDGSAILELHIPLAISFSEKCRVSMADLQAKLFDFSDTFETLLHNIDAEKFDVYEQYPGGPKLIRIGYRDEPNAETKWILYEGVGAELMQFQPCSQFYAVFPKIAVTGVTVDNVKAEVEKFLRAAREQSREINGEERIPLKIRKESMLR